MTAVLFGSLFVFLLIGVPIALCLGLASIVAMIFSDNVQLFPVIVQRVFTQTDNFTLMAVPFFIMAGEFMNRGGTLTLLNCCCAACLDVCPVLLWWPLPSLAPSPDLTLPLWPPLAESQCLV